MVLKEYLPNCLTVKQVGAENTLTFTSKKDDKTVTLTELIDTYVPEFSDGASDLLSPILFNGHLQTAYTAYNHFENIDKINYNRLIVQYPDGAEGAVDFAVPSHPKDVTNLPPNQKLFVAPLDSHYSYAALHDPSLQSTDSKPMLIALHGLTGGSHESYVRSIIHKLTTQYGFEACVINSRGCCQSQITTSQLYNGGWTNDVRFCVKTLRDRFPNRHFYMIGYSLGASILSNYLGEEGDDSEIECAVVMGNPWDMARSAYFINDTRMGSTFYSPALTSNLVKLTKTHVDVLSKDVVWKSKYDQYLAGIKTVQEFDDLFTGPMFGYKNAMDYYKDASSYQRLAGLRTPLIGINSLDDPIVGGDSLPTQEFEKNPYSLLLETSCGGHIAWFKDLHGTRWYTEPVCKFFDAYHTHVVKKGLTPDLAKSDLVEEPCKQVKTTVREY